MRGYKTGPKNPYRRTVPTKEREPMRDYLRAAKDRISQEWFVKNQYGHVVASGFDNEAEAKSFIEEQEK